MVSSSPSRRTQVDTAHRIDLPFSRYVAAREGEVLCHGPLLPPAFPIHPRPSALRAPRLLLHTSRRMPHISHILFFLLLSPTRRLDSSPFPSTPRHPARVSHNRAYTSFACKVVSAFAHVSCVPAPSDPPPAPSDSPQSEIDEVNYDPTVSESTDISHGGVAPRITRGASSLMMRSDEYHGRNSNS